MATNYPHRALRSAYEDGDWESERDFTQIVLGWSWSLLREPLVEAEQQASLPPAARNLTEYYHRFKPFILEEARAIIAEGLEKLARYEQHLSSVGSNRVKQNSLSPSLSDAKPFLMRLARQGKLPRHEGNPLCLSFRGEIPQSIEHGYSMNVLVLRSNDPEYPREWLGIASERPEKQELLVKIIAMPDEFSENIACFQPDHVWSAHYLGSIVSEERMYEACLAATDLPCLRRIASGNITLPPISGKGTVEGLNRLQSRAVRDFLAAPSHTTLLLQGPPGTGKTTTIARLLEKLDAKQERTLVCAHSNKGVQVLAQRAVQLAPKAAMILVGVEHKIPESLKPLSLTAWYAVIADSLSTMAETSEAKKAQISQGKTLYVKELETWLTLFSEKRDLVDVQLTKFGFISQSRVGSSNEICRQEFDELRRHLNVLTDQIHSGSISEASLQALLTASRRLQDKWKHKNKGSVEKHVLAQATIIFATLVTCGRRSLIDMPPVDVLLVDEAAQSVEAATLIPMRYQPKKILLVGDPAQLPATVISKALQKKRRDGETSHYDWSMMWRLIKECGCENLMLTVQYRMHPQICQWPSAQNYHNQLVTAPDILPMKPLSNRGLARRPYAFYQVKGKTEANEHSHSVFNRKEAHYVLQIVRHLRQAKLNSTVGVITPYLAQKQFIHHQLKSARLLDKVEVNTVDGFQGDECDIIIISFVRTHITAFLEEFRRLNVALTRAKYSLIILGYADGFNAHDLGQLINDAKIRRKFFSEQALQAELATLASDTLVFHPDYQSAKQLQTNSDAPADAERVRALCLRAAREGDPHAQCLLADLTLTSDRQRALTWYRQAALQDHVEGQYHWGIHLLSHDANEAIIFLRRAAEQGHANAQYQMGRLHLSRQEAVIEYDVLLAQAWLQKAARQAELPAIILLAKYYRRVGEQELAFSWFQVAADQQDRNAQYQLALCYEKGEGTPCDYAKMMKYLRMVANSDHTEAQYRLAFWLANGGQGLTIKKPEAIVWYRKAAQQAYQEAYYPLAQLLAEMNQWQEAIPWYQRAAGLGVVSAKLSLARYYYKQSTARSWREAAVYYQQAADAGSQEAQYEYANLLSNDAFNDQDKTQGMFYYKKAADNSQGIHEAACYQYGFHCFNQKNFVQAVHYLMHCQRQFSQNGEDHYYFAHALEQTKQYREQEYFNYYRIAADAGHIKSAGIVAKMLEETADANSMILARQYHQQAAMQGQYFSQYRLARLLETGVGGPRDDANAFKWYTACANIEVHAKYYLACLLHAGRGCVKDEAHAYRLLSEYIMVEVEQGIKQNYLDAHYRLASMKKHGWGAPIDLAVAARFYQVAAVNGHLESIYQLGNMYETGQGVMVNQAVATEYYRRAAEQGHPLAQARISSSYKISRFFHRYAPETVPSDDELRQDKSCLLM